MSPALHHPFAIIAFDWDGTAVMSRQEDAGPVRALIERLLDLGVAIVVITGTNFSNIDHQLSTAIPAPSKRNLFISTNRGSEVFGFDVQGQPLVLWRRVATPAENCLLTKVADAVRDALMARTGLEIRVVYYRLNRRKIDLIPLPEWSDPPKSAIGDLLRAVQARLISAGLTGGLRDVVDLAERIARENGLPDARITSDVKHVEIGLTDKSDAVDWLMREVAPPRGILPEDVLIGGDEFGSIGAVEGSDAKMITPLTRRCVFVSVGPEPGGVPSPVIHLAGGPACFRELLADQVALHDQLRQHDNAAVTTTDPLDLPATPTADSSWLLVEEGFNPAREHEIESLFAVANGYVGTRGSLAEGSPFSSPATFVAGVFAIGTATNAILQLVVAPDWTRLQFVVGDHELRLTEGEILAHRRVLDLRQGLLWREWRHRDPSGRITSVRGLRFASLADRHVLYQAVTLTPENYSGCLHVAALVTPSIAEGDQASIVRTELIPNRSTAGASALVIRALGTGVLVAIVPTCWVETDQGERVTPATEDQNAGLVQRWSWEAEIGQSYHLHRAVVVHTARDSTQPVEMAAGHSQQMASADGKRVVEEHVVAWERTWDQADVVVDGDPDAQQALRFAVYHLVCAANPADDRISVGARGLTGPAYKGHVFWDTEIYLLPFYTFTQPVIARALLMYRYHTLPAAREKAGTLGYRGALYAWESAASGSETTPPLVLAPDGQVIRIRTGEQEHHISADIAYAVWQYWQATADNDFFVDAGAEILLETTRFWASRGQIESDGRYHIRHIIGPDEYHEDVDDDVYTNGMARWNLERGVETVQLLQTRWPKRWHELAEQLDIDDQEVQEWQRRARKMELGFDTATGLHEQFQGYFALEEIDLATYEPRTVAMDVLLGRERVQRSIVLKQADVVLLLHLLWDQLPPEVRVANFRYYTPRTAHDSSLSPAIHALIAARLGDRELANRYFRQTAEIDLANTMGNAAGGVHLGALGGLWQATVFGYAGMRPRPGGNGLLLDPHLPGHWRSLCFAVQWRGQGLHVEIGAEPSSVTVDLAGECAMSIGIADGPEVEVGPGQRWRISREKGRWGRWVEVVR
jgi:kojibiose phosphorylase